MIKREMAQLVQEWMAGTGYGISRIDVDGDQAVLVIYGSGNRPALSELGHRLDARLHRHVDLSLIVVPSEHQDYTEVNGSSP